MEPLLDLPIDQFFGALAELQLDPERRDDLMRQYRRANSAFAPIYGLLARTAAEDAGEGMQRADIVPISRPEGMSVFDAVRSGEAQLAVPQGLLDTVNATFLGIDAPSAAYQGLIPEGDMADEGFGTAAVMMGLGGLLARPAGSLGTGGRVAPRSEDDFDYVGYRTVERGTDPLQPSRVWVDGEPTDEFLDGVSITLRADPNAQAMHGLAERRPGIGYYDGEDTFLIGGQYGYRGEDPGEFVIRDPVILEQLRGQPDTNAANIDPLTGAAAMGASQQQQDPLASLRAYLAQNGLLSQ